MKISKNILEKYEMPQHPPSLDALIMAGRSHRVKKLLKNYVHLKESVIIHHIHIIHYIHSSTKHGLVFILENIFFGDAEFIDLNHLYVSGLVSLVLHPGVHRHDQGVNINLSLMIQAVTKIFIECAHSIFTQPSNLHKNVIRY